MVHIRPSYNVLSLLVALLVVVGFDDGDDDEVDDEFGEFIIVIRRKSASTPSTVFATTTTFATRENKCSPPSSVCAQRHVAFLTRPRCCLIKLNLRNGITSPQVVVGSLSVDQSADNY